MFCREKSFPDRSWSRKWRGCAITPSGATRAATTPAAPRKHTSLRLRMCLPLLLTRALRDRIDRRRERGVVAVVDPREDVAVGHSAAGHAEEVGPAHVSPAHVDPEHVAPVRGVAQI